MSCTNSSSCVMMMSWKCAWCLRDLMISLSAAASDSTLARSRLVVGSSRARMPQLTQKDSASARRMTREASTFWPAEQRPRMSSVVSPFFMTTR